MAKNFDFLTSEVPPGLSVIEASAGTGKTYALSHLVPRLLLEGWAEHIGQIVLVTYTNDAVRELSGRVRQVLTRLASEPTENELSEYPGVAGLRARFPRESHRAILQRALLDFDRLQVSTIHSFCQRIMQTEDVLCGCPGGVELVPDIAAEWETLAAEWWCEEIASSALLTALAFRQGWSRQSVAQAAGLLWKENGGVEWTPPPPEWKAALATVEQAPARWQTEADFSALRALLDQVGPKGWNQGHTRESIEEQILRPLTESPANQDPTSFWTALSNLLTLPSLLAKRSAAAKKLVGDLTQLPVMKLAEELRSLLPALGWALTVHGAQTLCARLRERLRQQGAVTYDDLIHTVRGALRGPRGAELAARLRERYRVILIDESQDTDAAQFEIFSRIFLPETTANPVGRMVLIGDPKQSIYAFRGADVNTYLHARSLAGEAVFTLTETYRAPAGLVAATNALFARPLSLARPGLECPAAVSKMPGDWLLTGPDAANPHPRATVWMIDDTTGQAEMHNADKTLSRLARAVAGEISHLLRSGFCLRRISPGGDEKTQLLRPQDIAVLTSGHAEAESVRQALLAQGVPARRAGSGDVLQTEEATELWLLLRALQYPRQRQRRRTALLTRLLGVTLAELAGDGENATGEKWLERFITWQQCWHESGLAAALALVDRDTGLQLRLARAENGERRLSNWRQLVDLVQEQALLFPGRIAPVLRWMENARAQQVGDPPEERLQQLESEAEAVQVLTMHSAKGLEFPLVFLPFAWRSARLPAEDGIFLRRPHHGRPRLVHAALAALAGCHEREALQRDLLEDRLRLLYVACTRAQVALWLVAGQICGPKNAPPCGPLDWILRTGALGQEPAPEWWEEVAGPGRGTRHAEGWAEILRATPGATPPWRLVPLPWAESPPPWQNPNAVETAEVERWSVPESPRLPDPWRFTSFSALTREKSPHSDGVPPESGQLFPAPAAVTPKAPARFRELPGGPVVGSAVHDWIETWDFGVLDRAALALHLREYDLPGGERGWVGPVGDMLEDLREVLLPGLQTNVSSACPEPRASEWHFQLPLEGPLEAAPLAAVFARHGEEEYAKSLALLPVGKIQGYLHGFLDRLAVADGSWGVIDWKTNQLGLEDADYEPDALLRAARASHYILQTYLYLVALRRFLGPKVPLCGAWLVYLRGIQPGTTRGVCHINPPPALLNDLDGLFRRPALSAL